MCTRNVGRLYDELTRLLHPANRNWRAYIDSFFLGCRVNNLTESSIDSYAERLIYLIRFLDGKEIETVTKQDIQQYILSMLDAGLSHSCVNGRIQAMQRFWNYLVEDGTWTLPNPMQGIKQIKKERKVKEVVTPEQIATVLRSIKKDNFVGYRNYAILMLFWESMIRRNELVTLTLDRIDLDVGLITVNGKGRKQREVAIGPKMIKVLHFYLTKYRNQLPGEYLFCARSGNKLDKDNLRHIIHRMGKKVGVKLHPHLIRHSAATWFVRSGGSPAILQRIMGHTSPTITAQYTHLNGSDLVENYRRFSPSGALNI